jgi:hypothetical protein
MFQKQKISDYVAFMRKMGKEGVGELPSAFELIRVKSKKIGENFVVKEVDDRYEDANFRILDHTHE